jgi:hypothetical protein
MKSIGWDLFDGILLGPVYWKTRGIVAFLLKILFIFLSSLSGKDHLAQ